MREKGKIYHVLSLEKFPSFLLASLCFLACAFMVIKQAEEHNEHPIASSIMSVPISQFPFPVVTFFSESQEASGETLVEDVLNHFAFDCAHGSVLAAEETPEEMEANEQCLSRSRPFRTLVKEAVKEVVSKLTKRITQSLHVNLKESDYVVRRFVSIFCHSPSRWNFPLGNHLQPFLFWNKSDPHLGKSLEDELIWVLASKFGTPVRQSFEDLKSELENVARKFNLTQRPANGGECHDQVLVMDNRTQEFLLALNLVFSSHQSPIDVGTLFRTNLYQSRHMEQLAEDITASIPRMGHFGPKVFSYDTFYRSNHLCYKMANIDRGRGQICPSAITYVQHSMMGTCRNMVHL